MTNKKIKYTNISNEFSKLRKEMGKTQSEMATIMGYSSPATISDIENGRKKPSNQSIQLFILIKWLNSKGIDIPKILNPKN